jgi:HlyD family type I secretion membrane fusion protein
MFSYLSDMWENARVLGAKILDAANVWNLPEWRQVLAELGIKGVELEWLLVGLVVALLLIARFLLRGRLRSPRFANRQVLDDLTRAPRRFGYVVTIALVFGLGTWSFQAPLAGAAIAPGVISPEGDRRTVEHLEGGIVREILVKEGDVVEAGQVLLTLEDIPARARFDEIGSRYVHLLAKAARLEAELRNSDQIDEIEGFTDHVEYQAAISNQRELLARRLTTRQGRVNILRNRIRKLEEENFGLVQIIEGLNEKAILMSQEIENVAELLDKGLERTPRMLALKRAAVDILIERASNDAAIARNNQKVGETELQLLTMHQQEFEQASEELTELRRTIAELGSEMPWRTDVLARTEIRAPVSGIVFDVRVTTLSGVLKGGEPILDIVPSQVPLIIDARVNPIDIDVLKIGMPARIILIAYQQRNMPQLFGTLRSISADSLVEDRTGTAYYLAKIEVPRAEVEGLPDVELVTGMPVDVMILTGESTVADYVIGPLIGSFRQSFRQNHDS